MARKKNIDADRILDAAERVVMNGGAHSLTLDMVAAEAGISKGGLTYTFATKEALLSALLDRDIGRFRTKLEALAASQCCEDYPELRTFLDVCRTTGTVAEKKVGAIIAGIMHAPGSLRTARSYLSWMMSKFSPDSDAGRRARLVFYATQGLFLLQGFGLLSLPPAKRKAVVEDFVSFLGEPAR